MRGIVLFRRVQGPEQSFPGSTNFLVCKVSPNPTLQVNKLNRLQIFMLTRFKVVNLVDCSSFGR